MIVNINELYDNRADPDARSVLEDYQLSSDAKPLRLGVALWVAAAAAAAADAACRRLTSLLTKEPDMRNGLKIIQVPGRYGYSVTKIGWLRRVSGDEWEIMPGARTLVHTSGPRTLDSLASEGPGRDHQMSAPAAGPEEVHRLVIRRSLPASVDAWSKHCPRPSHWIESDT